MLRHPRFFVRRHVPVILQSEAAECGLACIAMIATSHGCAASMRELRQRHADGGRGATLRQLLRVAAALGLVPHPVRLELDEIRQLQTPCILHWRLDHFVVLEKMTRQGALIVDPAAGRRRVRWRELDGAFSGVALELVPAADFKRKRSADRLRLLDLYRGSRGLGRSLLVILSLSAALQCLALLLPFYSQLVIDDVVLRGDRELLQLLALAFLLLIFLQALLGMCRAWIIVAVASRLSVQWSARVFRHLLRLPLSYFEYRQIGDIQSRFASLGVLQQLLTRQLVEALVDGVMAVSTCAVMLAYQPQLALLVLASILVYFCVRLALFIPTHTAAQEALAAAAQRENSFLESLRGVVAIKTSGIEAERQSNFLRSTVNANRADVRAARLGVWQLGVNSSVFGVQLIVVIWLGAAAIIDGSMTIGMLVAFLAYRALFTERAAAFIDRVFELRLARVHLERLADIVFTPAEADDPQPLAQRRTQSPPTLAAQALSFRHGSDGPYLLQDVSLTIRPGEHIALTGPSGAGKTTLVKLLMGLWQPTNGAVRVNGQALARFGIQRYRRQVAAVMQDDQLFSGSLLDNITLFDAQPDIDRCRHCAWLANLDEVIELLPLRYFTPVGDMGAALSGGERQRLLLARALYRQPHILFLDEFTSHMDPACERTVNARLAKLPMTRIVVAHRPETVAFADRQITIRARALESMHGTALQA
ncbi:MAG: peptidase domain-containing ABC transporter [Woeseia sp.]